MRDSRQSYSRSGGGNRRSSFRSNGSTQRSSGNFPRRSRGNFGGGRKQKSFNPTHVILQSSLQQPVSSQEEYQVQNAFSDFNISEALQKNIQRRGYTTPTPIQDQIIPHILEGRDAVGIANTGTGKTAAFLLPLLNKVLGNASEKVLIIVPTRELALQVRDELMAFAGNLRIYSSLCIGGTSIHRQIESLKRGQHFVIGTPGRIKDLNLRKKIRFEAFTNIVLDEVDRMLDMGFVHEIRAIIQALPQKRQSLFFSATMNDRVKEIMAGFLTNPVSISVKTQETTANVIQEIVKMQGRSKIEVLLNMLNSEEFSKVLVFGRTKHGTERLSRDLQQRGFRVNAIHGNKSQGQRQRALTEFKTNKLQALIATDVVARGLDVDNISHVINYDLPESYEDYVHRIGRTGRADKTGVALTFID